MLLPNLKEFVLSLACNSFQNILCYYQTPQNFAYLLRQTYFKTSYVTTKPTVLSRSSDCQFQKNRLTTGFSSNFTNRHSIFVTIPENTKLPCKIRLSCIFIKFPVGKLYSFVSNFVCINMVISSFSISNIILSNLSYACSI